MAPEGVSNRHDHVRDLKLSWIGFTLPGQPAANEAKAAAGPMKTLACPLFEEMLANILAPFRPTPPGS
jgi:hypothetical protein